MSNFTFNITAAPGTNRRRVQLVLDHHISDGRLVYGPQAFEDALVALVDDPDGSKSRSRVDTILREAEAELASRIRHRVLDTQAEYTAIRSKGLRHHL